VKSKKAKPHLRSHHKSTENPVAASEAANLIRAIPARHYVAENSFLTLIITVAFLLFLPVLKNDFVDSDRKILEENFGYHGVAWGELGWIFVAFHFGQYQPLAWMTLAIDQLLWWADPFGYHWTNLGFHLVNSVLVYRLSLELLSYPTLFLHSPGWRSAAAALVAVGFTIHPLRVESVAWASARGDLVASTLVLVSLLAYLKSYSPTADRRDSAWSKISIGAYLLSLLASPSGLFMPLALLIFDSYPLGRLGFGSQNPFGNQAWRILQEKWPYLISFCICVVFTFVARNSQTIDQATYRSDIVDWFLHQLAAPAFYLRKTLLPVGLSPSYELRGWWLAIYIFTSVILCGGIAMARRPALAAAGGLYLVFVLPVFHSTFPASLLLADRYAYLAGFALALLVVLGIYQFLFDRALRVRVWLAVFTSGVGAIVLVGLAILTWNQVRVWRDSETLWHSAVQANPTSEAYFRSALFSETQGKYEDAISSYEQAVAINPGRWDAREKVAPLLEKQGRSKEAIKHYRKLLELKPKAVDARERLAGALANQGEMGEAVEQFRKVVDLAPERNDARVKLGTSLALSGRLQESTEVLIAAVKANPSDGRVVLKLGQVIAAQGSVSKAMPYFREAVRLRSEDAEAQESLGRGFLELGKKDEASVHLKEAVRILRLTPAARDYKPMDETR
jgi:protein O-mannosyl-transferase